MIAPEDAGRDEHRMPDISPLAGASERHPSVPLTAGTDPYDRAYEGSGLYSLAAVRKELGHEGLCLGKHPRPDKPPPPMSPGTKPRVARIYLNRLIMTPRK